MINKITLVAALFLLILALPVSAEITYTPITKTSCVDKECGTTIYSTAMFAQNSQGAWVNPSDVLSITKNQDDITFNYDGIDGQYSITFEAGVIYNGNYFSFSQVKQNNPEINFNFPHEDRGAYYKYAVNISNLDELNTDLIENITLTYKSHEGFNLNQLKIGSKSFEIRSMMALYFNDLLDKYTLIINKAEKRLYISNITDNIIDGSLYLDPAVTIKGTGLLEDATIWSAALDDANFGASPDHSVGNNGDRINSFFIKIQNTLPKDITVTESKLFLNTILVDLQVTRTTAWGVVNQTWSEGNLTGGDCSDPIMCEKGITYNRHPVISPGNITAQVPPASTGFYSYNVTSWVENQKAAVNISFYINGTDDGTDEVFQFDSKEDGNPANRPYLVINYTLPDFGVNISTFDAVNGSILKWNVTFINDTSITEGILTSLNNINPRVFDCNNMPVGDVNVTIWRDGYLNATYGVPINCTHMENVTAFIFDTARGLVNLEQPANGSNIAGTNIFVNVTTPDLISGDLNNLFYELNGSGNFISLCTSCSGFTGNINLGGFGAQELVVRAHSTVYGPHSAETSFTNLIATYDLLIMDELRNVTFDMSLVDFANFTAFCPNDEVEFDITNNFTENVNIGCEFDYLQLRMKLFNQTASHFRTLIPNFSATEVTFHMIDNVTRDPDDNFIDVKLILDDLTGNFRNGIVHIRKAINGSIVNIIDQKVDAESSILAYLVIGERYFLSIESEDGLTVKRLGDFFIRDITETEKRIRITDLGLFPELQNFVNWQFSANFTEGFINLTYNDTLSQTSTITFFVYNATDPSNLVLLFSDTRTGESIINFNWPNAELNNTYLVRFIAAHLTFGEIRQDVVFIFSDRLFPLLIFDQDTRWYTIAALIVIMMTALLFGARVAQFGAVVVAIEAAFFVIIGWLDITNPGVLISLISLVMLLSVLAWIGLRRREQ